MMPAKAGAWLLPACTSDLPARLGTDPDAWFRDQGSH
jgi:hypothetical protein